MAIPWFLDALGLTPDADARSVRRSYAARLKAIDPETHPGDFARLREAFEAAKSWVEGRHPGRGAALASDDATPRPSDGRRSDLPAAQVMPDHVTPGSAADIARDALQAFLDDVVADRQTTVRVLLHRAAGALRQRHVDATAFFGEGVALAVRQQAVPRRVELFAAAVAEFHWDHVGHLDASPATGAWIERVLSQEAAWALLPEHRRVRVTTFITDVEKTEGSLRADDVDAWPDVREALAAFDDYLRLRLSDRTREAWASRYDALPARRKEKLERAAARRVAPTPRWRRKVTEVLTGGYGRFFLLFLGIRVVLAILKQFGIVR